MTLLLEKKGKKNVLCFHGGAKIFNCFVWLVNFFIIFIASTYIRLLVKKSIICLKKWKINEIYID